MRNSVAVNQTPSGNVYLLVSKKIRYSISLHHAAVSSHFQETTRAGHMNYQIAG